MGYFSSEFCSTYWHPSCIVEGQAIETPSGWEGVGNLLNRFAAGHRVEILVTDHVTNEQFASPLLFGLRTWAKATRLSLEDGRVVDLTDGHAVPSTPNTGDLPLTEKGGILPTRRVNLPECSERAHAREYRFAKEEYLQWIFQLRGGQIVCRGTAESAHARTLPQWQDRWAPIAVGDEVDGSPIRSIERIGSQPAARIAPAHIGWVTVRNQHGSAPVRVGTRLHEYHGSFTQGGRIYTNPLQWGAIHDWYDTRYDADAEPSCELSIRSQRYIIKNGPMAWAFEQNESGAAYAQGYLAARAARTARGIRILEDLTDTLRLMPPERRRGDTQLHSRDVATQHEAMQLRAV